jgi:acyl-CoA synthetase (AMP-forming)/AMP-acid ligase II
VNAGLTAFLDDLVAERADAVALVQGGPSGRKLTYGGLRAAAADLARRLHGLGLGRGDTVAVWLPNWLESVAWQFAAARLGAAVLGVNTRYNVAEATHLLRSTRPRCVAIPDELLGIDFAGRLREAVSGAGIPLPVVAVVGPGRDPEQLRPSAAADVGGGSFAWSITGSSGESVDLPEAAGPGETAVLFSTSGSTGLPKLARHDQAAVVRHGRSVAAAIGAGPDDVMLVAVPFAGVLGYNGAFTALAAGATVLLEDTFDPDGCLDDMARYGVTLTVGGDDLHGRLLDAWAARRRDLHSWRWAGIGDFAGRVGEVAQWAHREFGTAVCGIYGSSEVFALAAVRPSALPVDQRARAGGVVVDQGIEVRTYDPVTGLLCAPGETGELQLRGYSVTPDYAGDPEASAQALTDDGWFGTGDLGSIDGDVGGDTGFTYVCRAGDALRLRGFLVEPAEIEQHLAAHAGVAAVRVVGARGGDGGDVAVAFVVARAATTLTEAELVDHCASGLAAFKVPGSVLVVDEFPTTSGTNGTKIKNAVLRGWAQQALDRKDRRAQ